jgi:hypothetical protein
MTTVSSNTLVVLKSRLGSLEAGVKHNQKFCEPFPCLKTPAYAVDFISRELSISILQKYSFS